MESVIGLAKRYDACLTHDAFEWLQIREGGVWIDTRQSEDA